MALAAGIFLVGNGALLVFVRERAVGRPLGEGGAYWVEGWRSNVELLRELPRHRALMWFFGAMLFYVSGLMAVVAFASVYAGEVFAMGQEEALVLFLVLQAVAAVAALVLGRLMDRVGARPMLGCGLVLWVVVCLWAGLGGSKIQFWGAALVAGVALGAVEATERAVIALLAPGGRSGEYFGCWSFVATVASMVGVFVFGWLATGVGFRAAMVINAGFFVVGFILLPRRLMRN